MGPRKVNMREIINIKPLQEFLRESIAALERGERVKDFEHLVFEAALTAFFGPECWIEYNRLPGSTE